MKKYKLIIGDTSIEFRPMSIIDVDRYYFILQENDPNAEEYIFQKITEEKYDIEELNAGIIPLVVSASMRISGYLKSFNDFPDKLDRIRESLSEKILFYLIFPSIIKAQPSYNIDQLKNKTLNEILECFTISEIILTGKTGTLLDTKKLRELSNKDKKDKPINTITNEELEKIKKMLDHLEDVM